jgi:hypothetical protein
VISEVSVNLLGVVDSHMPNSVIECFLHALLKTARTRSRSETAWPTDGTARTRSRSNASWVAERSTSGALTSSSSIFGCSLLLRTVNQIKIKIKLRCPQDPRIRGTIAEMTESHHSRLLGEPALDAPFHSSIWIWREPS